MDGYIEQHLPKDDAQCSNGLCTCARGGRPGSLWLPYIYLANIRHMRRSDCQAPPPKGDSYLCQALRKSHT